MNQRWILMRIESRVETRTPEGDRTKPTSRTRNEAKKEPKPRNEGERKSTKGSLQSDQKEKKKADSQRNLVFPHRVMRTHRRAESISAHRPKQSSTRSRRAIPIHRPGGHRTLLVLPISEALSCHARLESILKRLTDPRPAPIRTEGGQLQRRARPTKRSSLPLDLFFTFVRDRFARDEFGLLEFDHDEWAREVRWIRGWFRDGIRVGGGG